MEAVPPEPVGEEPLLRRIHGLVLALLAGAALAIATLGTQAEQSATEPPLYSLVAVLLAAIAIVSREEDGDQ